MFAVGNGNDNLGQGILTNVLWLPFFNIGLGMNPAKLGIVMMILRAWDAVSDPLVGNFSDNTRTRWGRRRPFILLGAILCAVFLPLFFYMPASLKENGKLLYLTGLGIMYFTFYTVWSTGYYSLQLEMTPNYNERTRLAAWCSISQRISQFFGGWVMAIVTSRLFMSSQANEPDLVAGCRAVSWLIAGAIILFGILPAVFVKERYYKVEAGVRKKEPFWLSMKESFSCTPLWFLIATAFLLAMGTMSVGAIGYYVNAYYVYGGDLASASVLWGWRYTFILVIGVLSIPFWTWLGEQIGKKHVVVSLLTLCVIGHWANRFLMRPEAPYLQLISAVAEACAVSAIWMFLPSMKADVADYDELMTSRRREGSLNAFFSWFLKAGTTLAAGVGGFVLNFSGFSAELKQQPEAVLSRMFNLYLWIPIVLWSAAILFCLFYPLGKKRMLDIRTELEHRRGTV